MQLKHGLAKTYVHAKCRCSKCYAAHRRRQKEYMQRRAEKLLSKNSTLHGTEQSYQAGCRCNDCKAAQSNMAKKRQQERLLGGKFKHGKNGYRTGCRCKKCRDDFRDDAARKKYGLTVSVTELLENAGNKCQVCSKRLSKESMAIDHCHKTGKVRGVLCHGCNTGIGAIGDNAEAIRNAVLYVQRHKNNLSKRLSM